MHSVLIILIVVTAGSLSVQGVPAGKKEHHFKNQLNNIIRHYQKRDHVAFHQQERRQSQSCRYQDCNTASSKLLNNDNFINCVGTFNGILDNQGVTDEAATTFCKTRCNSTMDDIFVQIQACCGDDGVSVMIIILMKKYFFSFLLLLMKFCKTHVN